MNIYGAGKWVVHQSERSNENPIYYGAGSKRRPIHEQSSGIISQYVLWRSVLDQQEK